MPKDKKPYIAEILEHAYDNPGLILYLIKKHGFTKKDFNLVFTAGTVLKSPLTDAVIRNLDKITTQLVKQGICDINQRPVLHDRTGDTCLESTVRKERLGQTALLLELGAKQDRSLDFAVRKQCAPIARLLQEHKFELVDCTTLDLKKLLRKSTQTQPLEDKQLVPIQTAMSSAEHEKALAKILELETSILVTNWNIKWPHGKVVALDAEHNIRVPRRAAMQLIYIDLVKQEFLNPVTTLKKLEALNEKHYKIYRDKSERKSDARSAAACAFFSNVSVLKECDLSTHADAVTEFRSDRSISKRKA